VKEVRQGGPLLGATGTDGAGDRDHEAERRQHAADVEPQRPVVVVKEERQDGHQDEDQSDSEQREAHPGGKRSAEGWEHASSISGAVGIVTAISCDIGVRTTCGRFVCGQSMSNEVFTDAVRQGEVV
jgi:hypothetical protein